MTKRGRCSVAVLGLGPMGAPVAANLLAAGHAVTVWNRTLTKAADLAASGARVVRTPREIDADVILSVLPDVPELTALLDERTLDAWRGCLLVVMSTTSPANVRALADAMRPRGIEVADAPMTGGDRGARDATLGIMVGCAIERWPLLHTLLGDVATTVARFGATGSGSAAKLCNQVVVAATLAATAEALALGARLGLDAVTLVRTLQGGLASSAVLDLARDRLLARRYEPGGSAANQLKDLRYAHGAGDDAGARLPLTIATEQLFAEVVAAGLGAADHSVVLEILLRQTGSTGAERS